MFLSSIVEQGSRYIWYAVSTLIGNNPCIYYVIKWNGNKKRVSDASDCVSSPHEPTGGVLFKRVIGPPNVVAKRVTI